MPGSNPNSIFLYDCSAEEISKIMSELENGKSSDISYTSKNNKKSNKFISPILAQHFNYLIKIGKFPDDLKTDRITPIYKKYNTELLDNYRPISTLPIFGKLFGKIIYSRLYSFFVSQNLLHERQFGFRKNHSTSHAINYSINHINNSLKKNMCLRSLLILAKHSTLSITKYFYQS